MNEEEAHAWMVERWPGATGVLDRFAELLRTEASRQNLIARSTLDQLWSRHVVDSAQLAVLAPGSAAPWIDIGTGGGFPGLVCALLRPERFVLVEPRRRRAAFLTDVARELGLANRVEVIADRAERVCIAAGTISARAVASITELLTLSRACLTRNTCCLFPRGTIDPIDVAHAQATWNMTFHVEHSVTNPASAIAVINGVSAR